MSTSIPNPALYTDINGLSVLAQQDGNNEAALRKAGEQFEALFIQSMLKSMREAAPVQDSLLGDAGRLYRDLFDKQIALVMAGRGELGLADMMVEQLRRGTLPQRPGLLALSRSPAGVDTDSGPGPAAQAFVKAVWPHARAAAGELGVPARALVAQAALESGWGAAVMTHPDGRSSHNLFGIKADARWDGDTVTRVTTEYRGGKAQRLAAVFRSYDSYAESFADYVNFLRDNPRYQRALSQAGDPGRFFEALQSAGYATDPRYAEKIQGLMDHEDIKAALGGLKKPAAPPTG
ncbi:MAG TPA: flagellar assembly peptidoglycan hydrolase FlgJ [Gammaproteobacteria bacterium]|nr:flagellar assembly peptidoglycan hydrolase FlgJ [Gammaproteobacteria bacterium]